MSWWDDGDDVLGDGPADALKGAWRTFLARRNQQKQPPPTQAEALEAFAAALHATPLEPSFHSMVLWRDRERIAEHLGTGNADGELTRLFAEAMGKIVQDYQSRFSRPPRPSEIIKTLDFILRPSPEVYFSDVARDGWHHLRLRAG